MTYRLKDEEGTSDASLRASLEAVLSGTTLFSLATNGPDGAHINTAFFAADSELDLYFVSERSTRHSQNVASDPRAAATVMLQPPQYGEHLQGVQLFGHAHEARETEAKTALACYQGRFTSFAQDAALRDLFLNGSGSSALYRFRVDSLMLLDEPRFGRRQYLEATVIR
ncbi:pyridoxamine 5'-phosphate oxidase family protein [Streptomyces sp. WAC00263]|uniref:pyridoxamine 5'-phosphate oxidase family protein n=1 Tax=Streptomyces sp. WAC00263 TaxID=1917422 RepID=UPI0009D294A2|nr:pyridoxamine 5'-phosphate oxidase family protein [Streptomyces sp. WAC00263]KAF5994165.1 hypothetical protein BOG92_022730 [Streptomyces sp. WAC00263]